MWPPGHLAVGYLAYVAVAARSGDRLPADRRTLAVLVVGTQLPDLLDKPLGYWGMLPSGRSLGHSLVVLLLALGVARAAGSFVRDRRDHPLATRVTAYWLPLTVGVLAHLAADSYRAVLGGRVHELRYLAWPLIPAPTYPADAIAPWERLLGMTLTPAVAGELLLCATAVAVFVRLRVRSR